MRNAHPAVTRGRSTVLVRDTREPGGISTRPGAPCGVPGLAVVAGVRDAGVFSVVHVRSGLAAFPDPESALAGAQAAGELADYTAPAADLRADPDLSGKVEAALRPLGAFWTSPLAPPDSLADLTEA